MNVKGLSKSALFAKVKACSTAFLSDDELFKAASCTDLADFASYLKNRTPYSAAFEGIGSSVRLTRQHIESVIKRMILMRLEKIIRYASITDNFVTEFFMMQHETECIASRLRQHGAYTLDNYLMYMPSGFFEKTSFDLDALEHATDVKSILDILSGTRYGDILAPILENREPGRWIPENILYRNLFEQGSAGFKKKLDAESFGEVETFIAMLSDMLTVNNIYRIKKYYPDSEDTMILKVFSSSVTRFTPSQLSGLKKAENASEFTAMLAKTKYKELPSLFEGQNSAVFTRQYVHNVCKKKFASTSNAPLAALCYSRLVSDEADSLIAIAEGLSSGMDAEKIFSMLIR